MSREKFRNVSDSTTAMFGSEQLRSKRSVSLPFGSDNLEYAQDNRLAFLFGADGHRRGTIQPFGFRVEEAGFERKRDQQPRTLPGFDEKLGVAGFDPFDFEPQRFPWLVGIVHLLDRGADDPAILERDDFDDDLPARVDLGGLGGCGGGRVIFHLDRLA